MTAHDPVTGHDTSCAAVQIDTAGRYVGRMTSDPRNCSTCADELKETS